MLGRRIIVWMPFLLFLSACGEENGTKSSVEMEETTNVYCPLSGGEMVSIAGGHFTMGDPRGAADETPHEVTVSAFLMDKYPVSQELYEKITNLNPSKRRSPKNPIERIQWTDAAQFCNHCSELEGLTPCYDPNTWECNFEADGFRLPTEAEWEYACRAGSQTRYSFGDSEAELSQYAWLKPHSRGRTWPVGRKSPNPWGLYDMHGNVWEWCNDFYGETYYAKSPRENPTGPSNGKKRVLRGGAWNSTPEMCRAAYRFSEFQVFADACFGSDSYGFRRVKNVQTEPHASGKPVDVAPTPVASPVSISPTPVPVIPDSKIDSSRLEGNIVFVSDRGGSLDIWKMNARGGELKQITNDAYSDADPRFSPSGERILYTSLRDGFPQVWMMNVDGSSSKRITEGSQANWSPDEHAIVFVRDDQVHVRELASEKERRLTPEGWRRCGVPAWSPDGGRIALASRHLEKIGVFILEVDGKGIEQLKTEEPSCTPQWSPDGGRILFQTDKGHIHQMYTEDGTEEQVTFGADIQHDARFSPDGAMIVFCRASSEQAPWQIWITDLESDDLDSIQITNEGSNRQPDWH